MAGVGGFKAGYAGLKLAQKNNEMFAANLKESMRGMPKRALGIFSATVLDMAIEETKHDSSRFAANWELSFGTNNLRERVAPSKYFETTQSAGTIGGRDFDGAAKDAVVAAKRVYYGYGPAGSAAGAMSGGLNQIAEGGRIHEWLNLGGNWLNRTLTNTPKVQLYNPLMRGDKMWVDGYGNSYPFNALYGDDKGGGVLFVGADEMTQRVGNAVIQMEILRLQSMVRWAKVKKEI
jgi:hypothetical protein